LQNETFREICSSETIKVSFGNPPYERWLTNTNKLLTMYDGVYGVKTGFTDEAGRCLVSACERDGKNLICVTLNDKNDWDDHIAMYDYGFEAVKAVSPELPDSLELNLVGADSDKITLVPDASDLCITTLEDNFSGFSCSLVAPPFVYAPVKYGEQAAQLRITYNDRLVCTVPLVADRNYDASEVEAAEKNKNTLEKIILWLRQYRTRIVVQIRSKIFRQIV
jgi:D-alanyl-D-alanine carboxypeptidase/D-alanyl-D-alanine carboxypeptidase (penicillin-binding protein 5/6)